MNPITRILFTLLTFIAIGFCVSLDTLTPGRYLKGGDVLVSTGETFALGFFSPVNSNRCYLGIWFNKVSVETIVWVANRNNPITDNNPGILTVSDEGNLVLFEEGNQTMPVWSTNISSISRNSTAQLLDTGNLVLLQQGSNEYLWQSFDYPTNVVVPNMKFGVDLRSGLDRSLTSWKSIEDPGLGDFSCKMDIQGQPQLTLYKGHVPKWRSGPWTGQRWSGTSAMTNMISLHPFVNADEMSVSYTMIDASVLCHLVLTETGLLHWLTWNANENRWIQISSSSKECNKYGKCGPNSICDPYDVDNFMCSCLPGFEPTSTRNWGLRDGSKGCMRKVGAFTCQSGEGFVKVTGVKLPDVSVARVELGMSLKECEQECLKDCSCTAFTSTNSSKGTICFRWRGNLLDTRKFLGATQNDIYIRLDATEKALYMESSDGFLAKKGMIALTATSIATVSLITISTLYWLIQRKKNSKDFIEELDERRNPNLPLFKLSTISIATDHFSTANKLGEGGFGPVYKGRLENGEEIAVKRLAKSSRQGTKEFKTEVRLIPKLQHKNLVRVVGYCVHKDESMLIYEFLPHKSLDWFIFDSAGKMLLDWKKRFEIITGIARGLSYLHHDSRLKVIHRDLKASNILLDAAMNPKISDFGTARIFEEDQSEANTHTIVGTYGYMSPEYTMRGLCSIKSDVFSFGVLTLEIISGMRNNAYYEESPTTNMTGLAWDLWREGKAMDIVDSSLQDFYTVHEVLRCIQIGLLCVQESAIDRPTMWEVLSMLGNDNTLASPKTPAYIFRGNPNSLTSRKTSVNSVTLTVMEPR